MFKPHMAKKKKGNLAVSSKDVAPADVRIAAGDPLKKSFFSFCIFLIMTSRVSLKELLILVFVFFGGPPHFSRVTLSL